VRHEAVGHGVARASRTALFCFFVLLKSTHASGVELALCGTTQGGLGDDRGFYAPDGAFVELAIFEKAPDHCSKLQLPVSGSDVLSVLPVRAEQALQFGDAVVLQGREKAGRFSVSEVVAGEEAAPASDLPMEKDVLGRFLWRAFGDHERTLPAPARHLVCSPGRQQAGAVLRTENAWPGRTPSQLELSVRGEGRFGIALSDAARWKAEAPLAIGELDLTGARQSLSFPVPPNAEGWTAITLTCPGGEAWLELQGLQMQPLRSTRATSRSAWIWSPSAWLAHAESIWALQSRYGLDAVYITIPVEGGKVSNPEALAAFVRTAHSRKLGIWAVIGDPHDVLPESRRGLLERLSAYTEYNRDASERTRLAGVQLDVEPYLLPGYALAPARWRQRYVDMAMTARSSLDAGLPLELVVPVWWGSHPEWGRPFLDALAGYDVSLTVMNYRTDPRALREGAEPFLEWGSRNRRPVRIAVETGPLPDEVRRHYRAAQVKGELWLLQLGAQPVLALLAKTARDLPGRAFAYSHSTPVAATNFSFAGDPIRLTAALADVVPIWAAWPGFAGTALHGMDTPP
jgi:hypothetical protein